MTSRSRVTEANGVTSVTEIDFGVSFMDFFGKVSVPTHLVVIKKHSATQMRVVVTGDLEDDVLTLFIHGSGDLMATLDNAFTLQPQGQSGDSITGLLGLSLLRATTGDKRSSINFRATEAEPSRIAFTSNRDGNDEIYVMDADGSNQTNITNNPTFDSAPDCPPSPLGDAIA